MAVAVEMTPELAMRAVETLRAALDDIAAGKLDEGCLLPLVQNEVYPHKPDDEDIAWANAKIAEIITGEK